MEQCLSIYHILVDAVTKQELNDIEGEMESLFHIYGHVTALIAIDLEE